MTATCPTCGRSTDDAVGLKEASLLLKLSYEQARRKMRDGTFPVPALPRGGRRDHWKFSRAAIQRYLDSSLEEAKTA